MSARLALAYLTTQVLLLVAWLAVCALKRWARPADLLAVGRTLLVLAWVAPIVAACLPRSALVTLSPGVMAELDDSRERLRSEWVMTQADPASPKTVVSSSVARLPLVLFTPAVGIIAALGLTFRSRRQLAKLIGRAVTVYRAGTVRVVSGDGTGVPFACRLSGAVVYLPLTLESDARRIALWHELQHHRQGDPLWHQLGLYLRAAAFANPVAWAYAARLDELEEMACDAAVVGRHALLPREYGRCLLAAAQHALHASAAPAGTTGFLVRRQGSHLRRRVLMLLNEKPRSARVFAVAALVACVFQAAVGAAAVHVVQDRYVTRAQAEAWARRAETNDGFALTVTPMVLAELNRLVGSAEARAFVRGGLARMEEHAPLLDVLLAKYGAPGAVRAIPLVESSYENYRPDSKGPSLAPGPRGAGVWMFIPSTAREYGLRVEGDVDERLDPEMSADAALRYLVRHRRQLGDWRLAFAAYNEGGPAVRRAMAAGRTRDAAELVEQGRLGRYLATVTAAAILMGNPEVLE